MNESLVNDLLELTREYQPTNETTFRARKISVPSSYIPALADRFKFVDAIFVYRKKNDFNSQKIQTVCSNCYFPINIE